MGRFVTDIERDIKAKMEEVGTPLKQLDVRIYRGVLTGLNDASSSIKQNVMS